MRWNRGLLALQDWQCFVFLFSFAVWNSAADRRGTARRNSRTISRGRGAGISVALSVSGWTDRFVVMGNVPPDGFHTTAKSPHYPNPARFLGVESQSTNAPPPQHCSAYFFWANYFLSFLGPLSVTLGSYFGRPHPFAVSMSSKTQWASHCFPQAILWRWSGVFFF